jgi:hypothetical protein
MESAFQCHGGSPGIGGLSLYLTVIPQRRIKFYGRRRWWRA